MPGKVPGHDGHKARGDHLAKHDCAWCGKPWCCMSHGDPQSIVVFSHGGAVVRNGGERLTFCCLDHFAKWWREHGNTSQQEEPAATPAP
jgi:hypothetical protein